MIRGKPHSMRMNTCSEVDWPVATDPKMLLVLIFAVMLLAMLFIILSSVYGVCFNAVNTA